MRRHLVWLAGCMLLCAACTGRFSTDVTRTSGETDPDRQPVTADNNVTPPTPTNNMPGPGPDPGPMFEPTRFMCDVDAKPPELPLRRLSNEQYRNTVRDVVMASAVPGRADALMQDLSARMESLPRDVRKGQPGDTHGGYRRLDQVVHQGHIDVSMDVAVAAAVELTRDDAAMERLMGACATDADTSNDDACVTDFLQDFGRRALRRPLEDGDETFYRSVYDADGINAAGARDVVAVMLTAPQFLYHVEHGAAPVDETTQTFALGAFELAARLSYHFWQTTPDDELLDAAADGSLLTDTGYRAQLERVFNDPRTRASLGSFFKEWLWLDELPALDALNGTPLFDNFTGENQPSSELRAKMLAEIEDMAAYHTLTAGSSFTELFVSNLSFARDPELAAIYGAEPWDGQGTPPMMPEDERAGLITRAALLASGTASTRPIIRGFFARKALLCTTPPPPPDNAADFEINLSEDATTREVVEALTEAEGSTCAGCHQAFINGLGFATEGFDALGRVRAEQRLFDAEGMQVATKAVDTVSTPRIWQTDDRESTGAKDLSSMLADSGEVHACFVRHYWRFTFGRPEDRGLDGCGLESLRERVIAGAPLKDVMMEVALRPEFRQRSFE